MTLALLFGGVLFSFVTAASAFALISPGGGAFAGQTSPDSEPAPAIDIDAVYEWAGAGSSCDVSPDLIYAVGAIVSANGLINGFEYDTSGTITPSLFGATGDGRVSNTAVLFDTDDGVIDGNPTWDRPVGPFQLLPPSWERFGLDANGDGIVDPQNLWDASASAANLLCYLGAGTGGQDALAVRGYAGSRSLTQRILDIYQSRSAATEVSGSETQQPDGLRDEVIVFSQEEADQLAEPPSETAIAGDFSAVSGDWNGDGVLTQALYEAESGSLIPTSTQGFAYGAHVRLVDQTVIAVLVGDWDGDGSDSIALRVPGVDDTDTIEFYDQFGLADIEPVEVASGSVVAVPDGASFVTIQEDAEEAEADSDEPTSREVMTALSIGGEIELEEVEGIVVASSIANDLAALLAAAESEGIALSGWGWRSHERQIELRIAHCADPWETPSHQCSPPTARPGNSRHEVGLAIDFHVDGQIVLDGTAQFAWLRAHAHEYGLINLPSEPWHWSVDGR